MTDFTHWLAWQLALNSRLAENPGWHEWFGSIQDTDHDNVNWAEAPGVIKAELRLHNGTEEGDWLTVDGNTTNEVFRKMRDILLARELTEDDPDGLLGRPPNIDPDLGPVEEPVE